jgi:hypothetical protein
VAVVVLLSTQASYSATAIKTVDSNRSVMIREEYCWAHHSVPEALCLSDRGT